MTLQNILQYPGSKWKIAEWIVRHMPRHENYIEPFFGSGSVFFTKGPSVVETINDLDRDVFNLFVTIREHRSELIAALEMTPWSRDEFELSMDREGVSDVERARRFLVRCWQAHGARTSHRTGWKKCVNGYSRHYPELWKKLPSRILAIADRLKDAQVENKPALEVIATYKCPEALIYADPPYVQQTRSKTKIYRHEMTNEDHLELLDALCSHPGPVLLSGYASELYDRHLQGWERVCKRAQTQNAGTYKTDCLWINSVAARSLNLSLF